MKIKKSLRIPEQQLWIPITLPLVQGNKDYRDYKELLENIDRLLNRSGIESAVQEQELQKALALAEQSGKSLTEKDRARIQLWTSQALRCKIIRSLTRESFRNLAFHFGESALLQNFCRLVRK